jgi:dihydrolipoamide dehydrogenase
MFTSFLIVISLLFSVTDGFVAKSTPTSFLRPRALKMSTQFDYDLVIVGCGVGGHGAALHARANGLKTAILTGNDVGGTCVNRGCVPSKALLAAAGRVRELKNAHHLKSFGITVGDVKFDRAGVAGHANQLANRVKVNLETALKAQGVSIISSKGSITNTPNQVKVESTGEVITAKNIILAPGSVPFVPRGVEVDEKTVFTSDGGLKLEYIPQVIFVLFLGNTHWRY